MEAHINIWFEEQGKVGLSSWRVDLLAAIAQEGSISKGAERMEIPYRRAWEKIDEMESALGISLLDRTVGGPGGGGAALTNDARDLLRRFAEVRAAVEARLQERFEASFGSHG